MKSNTFLVELGVEELPAKKLYNIGISFYKNIENEIKTHNIDYSTIKWFATPRRIAVKIDDVNINNSKKTIIIKGPSIKNAFNQEGTLNNSAIFWMKKIGIKLKDTSVIHNKKGQWISYKKNVEKKININIFSEIVKSVIKKISIGKLMKWNQSQDKFFRPIRTLTLMYNDLIIPLKMFNISSNCLIRGHQNLSNNYITLNNANEYPLILIKKNYVIADYNERKKLIQTQCKIAIKNVNGEILVNNDLLDEVTSLVEWPVIHLAQFKKEFLKLPKIAIIHIIQNDQKCFLIYKNKIITNNFIFVSNIETKNKKNIIHGYEKVINSRLSDAQFFFEQDQKNKLSEQLIFLKNVIFQKKLGTLFDKTKRLEILSKFIANNININVDYVNIAATLSKCDLISNMVIAFPKIQGTIGMNYAINDGVDKEIAVAIRDQYKPCFSGDTLPTNTIGDILSISDKIDLITGMFIIDEIPSSVKDPYALRRSAIGILRIIIEKKININLEQLIIKSIQLYNNSINKTQVKKILIFIINKLYDIYTKKGYSKNTIKSVLITKNINLIEIDLRIKAISFFQKLKDSQSIILAIKRISSILKKFNNIKHNKIDVSLIESKDEKILYNLTQEIKNELNNAFLKSNYQQIITNIMQFNLPIHNFFNSTTINHKNEMIKTNRLNLLKRIEKLFLNIADFSILEK